VGGREGGLEGCWEEGFVQRFGDVANLYFVFSEVVFCERDFVFFGFRFGGTPFGALDVGFWCSSFC
jgi:hypothetical protein